MCKTKIICNGQCSKKKSERYAGCEKTMKTMKLKTLTVSRLFSEDSQMLHREKKSYECIIKDFAEDTNYSKSTIESPLYDRECSYNFILLLLMFQMFYVYSQFESSQEP